MKDYRARWEMANNCVDLIIRSTIIQCETRIQLDKNWNGLILIDSHNNVSIYHRVWQIND